MNNKPKRVFGGAGFYIVLLLCLAAVGVTGYFALFRNKTVQEPTSDIPSQTEVVGEAPEVEEPQVEASAPADVPVEDTVEMPEEPVDDVQVVAEAPHLVVSPLNGDVITAFSNTALLYDPTMDDWRTHEGIDIAAAAGTNVLAACAGTVSSVTDDKMMGTTVVISHTGGYQTVYSNLQAKPAVAKGDTVSAGQIIGAVGTTSLAESAEGPHLHFAVLKSGKPVDPQGFLNS